MPLHKTKLSPPMARSVTKLRREAEDRLSTTKRIYNPDKDDFRCEYEGKPYLVRAGEIEEFPTIIAEHVKKHLANQVYHGGGYPKNSREEILEMIDV